MGDDSGRQSGWYAVGGALTAAGCALFPLGLAVTPQSQTLQFIGLVAFAAGLVVIACAMTGRRATTANKTLGGFPRFQVATVAAGLLVIGIGGFAIFSQRHQASQASTTGTSQPTAQGGGVTLSFASWSQTPATPPPAERYTFVGTVHGLPKIWAVEVMVRVPVGSGTTASPAPSTAGGATWLVSPPATVSSDGRWSVSWLIQQALSSANWTVVANDNGCTTASVLSCPAGGGAGALSSLQKDGPEAGNVVVAVPVPATKRT